MDNYANKLQSIDRRHGSVGTELHLTGSLCDAGHTSLSSNIGADTSKNGRSLLECVQTKSASSSSKIKAKYGKAKLIMETKRKALVIAVAVSGLAIAYQANEADFRTVDAGFANLSASDSLPTVDVQANAVRSINSTVLSTRELDDVNGVVMYAAADDAQLTSSGFVDYTQLANAQVGPSRDNTNNDDADKDSNPTSPRAKMSGPVAKLAAKGGNGMVELVVRYDQHPEFFDDERVAELGGEVVRSYEVLNMRAVRISVAALEELAVDENVDWLSMDDEISTTSANSRITANLPAPSTSNAAYGGTGVGVAILDTGVALHGDLDPNFRQYSFLNNSYPTPVIQNGVITNYNDDPRGDGFGHGTHVAGIVTGTGANSDDDYKGSATNASVLSLEVLKKNGGGSMSDVMAALDWLLVYGSYFDIRVVNLSLGKAISESNATDPLVIAVENLWDAGIVVVVAAGNYGEYGNVTVTSPGNSRKVITIGSVTDGGTPYDYSDDHVSNFSSRGPTLGDNVLKPDLLAPGDRLVASIPADAMLAKYMSGRVKACKGNSNGNSAASCGSVYLEMSGTSMATPMVSAAVALMLQKDPSLTPATVKARLMRSAKKVDSNFINTGAGILDVDAAMNNFGVVSGQALSPLVFSDATSNGLVIEDTADLWGDSSWGAGYVYSDGSLFNSDFTWTDSNGVTSSNFAWAEISAVSASGFGWTDNMNASGYGWTDNGVAAKGYGWTDQQ